MQRLNRKKFMIFAGLSLVLLWGEAGMIRGETGGPDTLITVKAKPITVEMPVVGAGMQRPPVIFDHDQHSKSLNQVKKQDCGTCHILDAIDPRLSNPKVAVFKFPKTTFDVTDKNAAMKAYHGECASCHQKLSNEGRKSGPKIGMCGKCHVKKPMVKQTAWAWDPIFNYARHAAHVKAAENKCETCHHTYDKEQKKLIYTKNTENTCRACHKATDEENRRSFKKVAHAACIDCHMKLAQEKKKSGPSECKGCHVQPKDLNPEEIGKLPRLVREQKDMMDLTFGKTPETPAKLPITEVTQGPSLARMKAVPFNHKSHEPRTQFCSSCHHYSLEKCANCHSSEAKAKKGIKTTYERIFHDPSSKRACVGCHNTAKENQNCAGCHKMMKPGMPESSCPVCHRGPSKGQSVEIPSIPLVWDKEKVPEKLQLDVISKEYKPAELPHQKIIGKLTTISNNSSLARWFHSARDQALCTGCHHKNDFQAIDKAPKCIACHNRPFDPNNLGKPGIMGAYHQQCIGCHQAMGQKPTALECVKCHQEKDPLKTAAGLDGKQQ